MSFRSDILATVQPSATLSITQKAEERRRQGKTIFSFSAGESDFPTPAHVIQAAKDAMDAGETTYTPVPGTAALRKAVAATVSAYCDTTYDPAQTIISAGAKQVIYNALQATLNPGDEVIIPAPYWVSTPEMVRMNRGNPVIVDCLPCDQLKLTPDQLNAAITPRTKWFILNSPTNPSGATYSQQELQQLGAVLMEHPHVHILADDIYAAMVYCPDGFHGFVKCCPALKDRTLVVNGLSKSYAMTGWRVGYGVGPIALIKDMALIQSQTTSGACSISQAAALAALTGDQSFLQQRCDAFQKRRDYVVNALKAAPYIRLASPEGAFYAFLDCREYLPHTSLATDVDLCAALLDDAGLALVPGTAFGAPGFIRLSFALADEVLHQGLDLLVAALKARLNKPSTHVPFSA